MAFYTTQRLGLSDAPDVRLAPLPFAAAFGFLGIVITLGAGTLYQPGATPHAYDLALICFGLAIGTAGVWRLSKVVSRWVVQLGLVIVTVALPMWFSDGWLVLLALPVILADHVLGKHASFLTALCQTALLVLAARGAPQVFGVSLWALLGALWTWPVTVYLTEYPTRALASWAWESYRASQGIIQEARQTRGDLHAAMEGLRRANRQLALIGENQSSLRLRAESAEKTKAAFLANVSHELRTPLNMIIGLTEMVIEAPELYDEPIPPQVLEHLEIVNRNSQHLATLINDVLDLSQVEAGRMALHRERFSVTKVIRHATEVVRPLVESKGLRMTVELPDGSVEAYGDRTRIAQVVVNLMSNAARFTDEGTISVALEQRAADVLVTVADTGTGIAPDDQEAIFEPFRQGNRGQDGARGGSGLGLSISKQFIERHGGQIWLESELDHGTKFSFTLPMAPPLGPTAPATRWMVPDWIGEDIPSSGVAHASLEERVVVCDLSGALYNLLSRYDDSMEYVRTQSIREAQQSLLECPALSVLINADSPQGLMAMVIEAQKAIRQTPLVGCCISALSERAASAGVIEYLTKPVQRDQLQQVIAELPQPVGSILIVDDEPDQSKMMGLMVRSISPETELLSARGGQEGINILRHHHVDLVLLDMIMPGMDGWEFLSAVRFVPLADGTPIVIVSAEDPNQRTLSSDLIVGTLGSGLSVSKILTCSTQLAKSMRSHD